MRTQKEIETIKDTYDTSALLCNLFEKYKNYDSTLVEHYDPSTLFANRKKSNITRTVNNASVSIIEYKESLFKSILNKIKTIFKK